MFAIVDQPIDPRQLEAAVAHPGAGAILTFSGVTRDNFEGRPVRGLVYEAYADMAVSEMRAVADEIGARWPGARVAMVHRVGKLDIGEASVVIAVSAPHRDEAYEAGRHAIDSLKARVPIWKQELYDDGATWKVNAESPVQVQGESADDPDSEDPDSDDPDSDDPDSDDPDSDDPGEVGRTFGGPLAPGEPPRFRTRALDSYPNQDLNPYLRTHQELEPEVITSVRGPEYRGRWQDAFLRPAPLQVEIGPGNGFFLAGMAARHPELNWLGIEIRFKRVVLTARKLRRAGVENGRVLRYDARYLDDLFVPGEIDGLFINHPDPWARTRKAKHRLLGRPFAEWIVRAVRPGGLIRIKSDFHPNLDRFAELIEGLPLELRLRVDDVFAVGSPWGDDDVETNYQSKFRKKGEPVAAMELVRV